MSEALRNVILLRCAVGNVIDDHPTVVHISLNEIHQWLDDIMVMLKEEEE